MHLTITLAPFRASSMRVSDTATGGGAAPHASLQDATRQDTAAQPAAQGQEPRQDAARQQGQDPESKAPVLSKGLAPAVLNGCVREFNHAVKGVSNFLTNVELSLPQIIVIGEEGSGKSSVLESVAMLPLFPRDSDICTRMPIVLKMRHVEVEGDPELMPHSKGNLSSIKSMQIKMRLIYSDGRAPIMSDRNFSAEEAAQLMRKWMEQIVQEELDDNKLKGVVEHVLEIEVRSLNVPNLNLIDLPGIVAGKLIDEPDNMMQRTRALAEKYLQMDNTFVLAVVPAFDRVRNSQAFQLVQQYKLMDKAIGVLTMVDRAVDSTNPHGPLAEVKRRLDGTSGDIVYLKEGYVAVMNRDTRQETYVTLDEFKTEENAWMEENLPGYIVRGLASSSVLVKKLEKMFSRHIREVWVPAVRTRVEDHLEKSVKELTNCGSDAQGIVNDFLRVSPSAARKQMMWLIKPLIPEVLRQVDEEVLRLMTLVHADFLQSREENELVLAPFHSKDKQNLFQCSSGSLVAASMMMLNSHTTYITEHLGQILKNVVLHLVMLLQKVIASSRDVKTAGSAPQRLDRFDNLHYFFAGVLWERLNEILIDDEAIMENLEKTFMEFDPENADVGIPTWIKKMEPVAGEATKSLAFELEQYFASKGFQNTSFDAVYASSNPPVVAPPSRAMSRRILTAKMPSKTKSPQSFKAGIGIDGFHFTSGFIPFSGFTSPGVFTAPGPIKYEEVNEFEARLFFAVSSHVVAPLLQSICDSSDLARRMQEYVACFPNVKACKTHFFHDKESDRRKRLSKRVKHLKVAAAELKLMIPATRS
ncbi:Dynamin-related protein 3A [Phytophthora citrophthora]|uniref:Dynamin-related protein 3A n=1 Tax=Phytophthora citrophthora TaxID=4793 RepID=A0AAD9GBH9_9STRA|nr:Dynamin-related protein 3A [Phytophthora citrophthora]